MKLTHIDNCSHGYLSVSKKDFLKVLSPEDISGYSGHNYTRVYLEEDDDASKFIDALKEAGIEYEIKRSYNPSFSYHHNYNYELFNYNPAVGDIIDDIYVVREIRKDKSLIVRNLENEREYKIPGSNPFKYINKVRSSK